MINETKINAIKKGKPISLIDIIVMAAVLCVALIIIFLVIYKEKGQYVSVMHNGCEVFYSLESDQTIDVGGHLTLKIENGYVFVVQSDCKNHDCIELGGKIRYVGQKIVCLPNKVVIKVVASNASDPEWATS